jgi:hypothetical protein
MDKPEFIMLCPRCGSVPYHLDAAQKKWDIFCPNCGVVAMLDDGDFRNPAHSIRTWNMRAAQENLRKEGIDLV